MANSKSNIYPIALQNAELNLNKYDAEIKQYSGFNKNNAPFVGGCLSNIFTKDEVIEGANDSNTIIIENGDKYTVDTEGFYRNGEKLISIINPVFWEQEEIEVNDNVIKLFNENIKVVKGNTLRTFNLLVGNTETLLLDYTNSSFTTVQLKDGVQNNTYCIYLTFGNKLFAVVAGLSYSSSDSEIELRMKVINMDSLEIIYDNSYVFNSLDNDWMVDKNTVISICYDSISNQISFFCSIIRPSNGYKTTYAIFFTINNITGELTYVGYDGGSITEETNKKFLVTSFAYYHVCSFPYNTLLLKSVPSADKTFTSPVSIYTSLISPYYDTTNRTILFREKKDSRLTVAKVYGTTNKNTDQEYNLSMGTVSSLIGVFDFQSIVKGTSTGNDKSLCVHLRPYLSIDYIDTISDFSFFDYETSNLEFSKARFTLGDQINLGNTFKLLFNNNQLSAISGTSVLLTDWNNIDASSLITFNDSRDSSLLYGITDERIYYKSNNKWYVIKHGSPKIKLMQNQIVINADQIDNSFDIKRKKVLYFACNYNGFIPVRNDMLYEVTGVANNFMVAGAVNEYSQYDNSSIILNPFSIYRYESSTDIRWNMMPLVADNVEVNVYDNAISRTSEILYRYTIKNSAPSVYGISINPEITKLPYPIDSNGNVEYNVSLFSIIKSVYGNNAFIVSGSVSYPLAVGNDNEVIMSYYLASGVEGLEEVFIIQGQFYGIFNNNIYSVFFSNGVLSGFVFVVSISNLQFVGNTPYEALFYSKTNRCLYSFTGANVLYQKQFVDKISEVNNYLYNPATQTVFLITDIGILFYSLFGQFLLEYTNIAKVFLLDNGIVLSHNNGNYRYIKYYIDDGDEDFIKQNIKVATCFYGMDNQTVTINDCLYIRLYSEDHEEGEIVISASILSLQGRKTEKTTFKFKAADWDKMTHTIYLRYQPKEQRGLGISFSIDSPFKIASLSVGSKPDAILVDKVSKGAVNEPFTNRSSNIEW